MEKKALVLLSLGAILGLASCGGDAVGSSSAIASTSETASSESQADSEIASSSESSSAVVDSSTSSSEPAIEVGAWSADMEEMLDILTNGHVPPVTVELAASDCGIGSDSDGNYAIVAENIDYSLVEDWAAILVEAGYEDNTDIYASLGYQILEGEIVLDATFEDASALQIDIYFWGLGDEPAGKGTGTLNAYLYYVAPTFAEFPAASISEMLETHFGITGVEVPAFEADDYTIYEPDTQYPYIEVDGTTATDQSAAYEAALEAAGWTAQGSGYLDATGAVLVEFGFAADYGTFYILVMPAPSTDWPTDLVNDVLDYLGVTGVEIPALDGADSYEVNTTYLDWLGVAYVLCYGIDGTATYNAALEAAGWTYDAENEMYIDPSEAIAIYAEYYEGDGTQITIQLAPAKPVTEYPAADLAAILADYGYSDVTIPAPEGEFTGYMIDDTFADDGTLCVACYSATDYTESYEAQLEAAGWTYDADGMWYVSPDNADITLSPCYYAESGYLEIAIYWPAAF